MRLTCTLLQRPDGRWDARHESSLAGEVRVTADTRQQALDKLRGEVRYRLELCPCTGESYRHLELQVVPGP